jgi:hypothetical protein
MKTKFIIITVVIAILLIALITTASLQPIDGKTISYNYLKRLGWQTDVNPVEEYKFTIPEVFDDVYKNYNSLQKEAGFDLSKYRGKSVTRYTYLLKNFNGRNDVRANVIVDGRKVIGGDIMTVAVNGFMLPLKERNTILNGTP